MQDKTDWVLSRVGVRVPMQAMEFDDACRTNRFSVTPKLPVTFAARQMLSPGTAGHWKSIQAARATLRFWFSHIRYVAS